VLRIYGGGGLLCSIFSAARRTCAVAFYLKHRHAISFCPHSRSNKDLQLRVWFLVAFEGELELRSCLGTFVDAIFLSVDMMVMEWCLLAVKMKQK
jgi:hypothetical protein